jgi:hypothetical protein
MSRLSTICENLAETGFDTAIVALRENWLGFLALFMIPFIILSMIWTMVGFKKSTTWLVWIFSYIVVQIINIIVFLLIVTW